MKRIAQVFLFAVLLAVVALALPHDAQAYNWSTVRVDSEGDVGKFTSIAVSLNGDPMISYWDSSDHDIKLAVCHISASAHGNCDQTGDWTTLTVDSRNGGWTSIALDPNGDPMMSYGTSGVGLTFATCDLPATGCDETTDWSTVTVDSEMGGMWTSIAVDPNGDPMISHIASNIIVVQLKFATCDMSATACDEQTDWTKVTVDSTGAPLPTSIAVDPNGDPMISYCDGTIDLGFATCDLSATACDEQTDWTKVAVDSGGGYWASIAVDANGDPMISYWDDTNDDLKFAICDMDTGCDATGDWTKIIVDSAGKVGRSTSITLGADGDPMISYYDDTNDDLKFATCDLSATGCDEQTDWTTEVVDSVGGVVAYTSIAVGASAHPMISYYDEGQGALKFATSLPPQPVGGIAVLPDAPDSPAPDYMALAALAAAALVALSAGGWYARRRWVR